MRGHVFSGVEAAPPIDDELASFLYRDVDPRERERDYVNLVAEPATPIETGRIADLVALCTQQILAHPRAAWFQRMLDESTTLLLGGNVVDDRGGELAYGIATPGQVLRLGLEDIAGASASRTCESCGREVHVTHRVQIPQATDADVDAALVG